MSNCTYSLGQLYLRAGYVEARNGWYQKATQIEAKFDSWISWCTAMSVKGCDEALNPKKTHGWLISESLSISHQQ